MPQPEPHVLSANARQNLVEAFAGVVRALGKAERRGDLANLRRLDVEAPAAPAFFRIVVKIVPEAAPAVLRRYARLLQILAFNPDALASGSFGAAMVEAGVSELRVQRLLSARGTALAQQIRLIAHRLANTGTLPYRQIGDLLLVDDEDSEYAESIRLRIARDYWRALDRAKSTPIPLGD